MRHTWWVTHPVPPSYGYPAPPAPPTPSYGPGQVYGPGPGQAYGPGQSYGPGQAYGPGPGQPAGYGWPAGDGYAPAPILPAPRPSPLPAVPVRYPQLLRGQSFRWWRPLVAIGLFAAGYAIVLAITLVSLVVIDATGGNSQAVLTDIGSPVGFGFTVFSLIVLIPISIFAIRIAYRTPVGFVASVVGRFRLRWALRCALLVLPIWVVLMVIGYLSGDFTSGPHRSWLILMIMVVLFIPFQAAGEEFAFRGFVQQVFGSWFGNRWLALVIPGIISIPLFAAAHGSFNGWIFADLSVSAAAWVYLAWRTGGLEAGVAVHMVNNCVLMLTSLALGGFEAGFVSGETTGSWTGLLTSALTTGLAVVVISWQARRSGIQHLFEPGQPPAAAVGPPASMSGLDPDDGFGGLRPAQGQRPSW